MRPFKFFFGISLALIFFFFLAKIVFTAIVFAALMSVVFFIARKIKGFFYHLDWEHDRYGMDQRSYREFSNGQGAVEPLFDAHTSYQQAKEWNRIITIH